MTTQEFVKKEAELAANQMFPMGNEHETKMIARQEYRNGMAYGLTKGLEIAVAYRDWTDAWKVDYREQTTHTTSELLTIFLTEKYGK